MEEGAAGLDAELRAEAGRNEDGVVPGELRHGLGALLQPAVVGEATVVHLGVHGEADLEAVLGDGDGRGGLGEQRAHAGGGDGDVGHRVGGAGEQAVVEELAETLFAVDAAKGVQAGDGFVNERVGVGLGFAEDAGEDFELGEAAEEREDHRLHRHDGAVGGAGVAPGFEVVGRGDEGAGASGGGGLVHVVTEAHDLAGLGDGGGEIEVGGGVVGGVAAEDDEGLDRAGVERGSHVGDAGRGGRGGGHEVNGRADGAEGFVERVNECVDLGGQVRTGDDEAGTLVGEEVGGASGEPLLLVLELEALGELGELIRTGDAGGERGGEGEQVAAGEAQAVIRHRAGEGEGALDRVEAVEVGVFVEGLAALGEIAGVADGAGLGGEEIGVEREDALGLGEAVNGLHVGAAEGGLGGGGGRLVGDGLILGPDGLGQLALKFGDEAGAGRRAGGLGEEHETGAARGTGLGADGGKDVLNLRGVGGGAADGVSGGAIRIVEIKDGGLHDGVGGAAVVGESRVALELGGAAGVRLGEDGNGVAADRHGRRVVERQAGDDVFDRLAVGEDVRLGAAATGGQAHAAEGEGGGHELEKLAAIDAVHVVGALGELALDLGLHGGRGGEIVEAAPITATGHGLGGDVGGSGMVKFAFHRRSYRRRCWSGGVVLLRLSGGSRSSFAGAGCSSRGRISCPLRREPSRRRGASNRGR